MFKSQRPGGTLRHPCEIIQTVGTRAGGGGGGQYSAVTRVWLATHSEKVLDSIPPMSAVYL